MTFPGASHPPTLPPILDEQPQQPRKGTRVMWAPEVDARDPPTNTSSLQPGTEDVLQSN